MFLRRLLVLALASAFVVSFLSIHSVFSYDRKEPVYVVEYNQSIELLHVVDFLSTVNEYSNCQLLSSVFLYKAKKYFLPWKNHDAVSSYQTCKDKSLDDDIYRIMLRKNEELEVEIDSLQVSKEEKKRIRSFFESLADFSSKSNFSSFLQQMKKQYDTIVEQYQYTDEIKKHIQVADDYFGYSFQTIHIIVSPTKLYLVDAFTRDNQAIFMKDLYVIASLCDVTNGYLQFGTPKKYKHLLTHTVPVLLLETAQNYYGVSKEKLLKRTSEEYIQEIYEALCVSVYQNDFTETSISEYLERCKSDGKLFVSEVFDVLKHEYEMERTQFSYFISYFPSFFNSVTSIYDGGAK